MNKFELGKSIKLKRMNIFIENKVRYDFVFPLTI